MWWAASDRYCADSGPLLRFTAWKEAGKSLSVMVAVLGSAGTVMQPLFESNKLFVVL